MAASGHDVAVNTLIPRQLLCEVMYIIFLLYEVFDRFNEKFSFPILRSYFTNKQVESCQFIRKPTANLSKILILIHTMLGERAWVCRSQ